MINKTICNTCYGAGEIDCTECDGDGTYFNNREVEVKCECCDGTGSDECPDCDGAGEIED